MKLKLKSLLFILLITFSISNCTYDLSTPDVCFQENVLPIFISNCTMSACHNPVDGESDYDLTNYDGIMKEVTPKHPLLSEVYKEISGAHPSMPPDKKLSNRDVNTIKVWIKMGAQNSSNCTFCDTTNFSYSGKIQALFSSWCVGCHSGSNLGGGYNLSNYSGVLAAISSNRLSGALKHSSGFSPMPKSSQLSSCDLDAVEKWINAGYPNN